MSDYINDETPIWQLTVGEFKDLQRSLLPATNVIQQPEKKYVYGLEGIAQLFNCSKTTANEIKQSGKIDRAITQIGRTIVVDAELALSLTSLGRKKR